MPAAEAEVIIQLRTSLSLALPAWKKNEKLKMSSAEQRTRDADLQTGASFRREPAHLQLS